MMRLLKKQEVTARQNADKANEVAEGLKISRRVDALRELSAKTEQELELFRKASLEATGAELRDMETRKESLQTELRALEEAAKKELSKTDKKRLEDLKVSLADQEKKLLERKQELDLQEIDIALSLKEAKDAADRQKTAEQSAQRLHSEAQQRENLAKETLSSAQKVEERALREKKEMEEALALKDSSLQLREKQILEKELENINLSRELAVEKTRLADQRATLERALERIRKNRL